MKVGWIYCGPQLVTKHAGDAEGARKLLEQAVAIRPDFLPPRLKLRGEALD